MVTVYTVSYINLRYLHLFIVSYGCCEEFQLKNVFNCTRTS